MDRFKDLGIGDGFDFVWDPREHPKMWWGPSFFHKCIKIGPRKYRAVDYPRIGETVDMKIGSVNVGVFHVKRK